MKKQVSSKIANLGLNINIGALNPNNPRSLSPKLVVEPVKEEVVTEIKHASVSYFTSCYI